ncbi:unnamed protein product, partial [Musa banksii]
MSSGVAVTGSTSVVLEAASASSLALANSRALASASLRNFSSLSSRRCGASRVDARSSASANAGPRSTSSGSAGRRRRPRRKARRTAATEGRPKVKRRPLGEKTMMAMRAPVVAQSFAAMPKRSLRSLLKTTRRSARSSIFLMGIFCFPWLLPFFFAFFFAAATRELSIAMDTNEKAKERIERVLVSCYGSCGHREGEEVGMG